MGDEQLRKGDKVILGCTFNTQRQVGELYKVGKVSECGRPSLSSWLHIPPPYTVYVPCTPPAVRTAPKVV